MACIVDTSIGYDRFKYIHAPSFDHVKTDVMESKYSATDALANKFVVWNHNEYRVYNSYELFLQHLEHTHVDDRTFHEVIIGPQKLKFDIDAPLEKLVKCSIVEIDDLDNIDDDINIVDNTVDNTVNSDFIDSDLADLLNSIVISTDTTQFKTPAEETPSAKYAKILSHIRTAIRDAFFVTYGIINVDEIVCESHGPDKFSNHIIINGYYVSGHEQAQEFARRVLTYLPRQYHPFIDMSVNKRIQNFRLLGCHKPGSSRTKKSNGTVESTLISNVAACKLLPDITTAVAPVQHQTNLHPDDINAILKLCAQDRAFDHHKFKFIRGGFFIFRRMTPSDCEFCNRNHSDDNTHFLTTQTENGIISVFKHCRRFINEAVGDAITSAKIGEVIPSILQQNAQSQNALATTQSTLQNTQSIPDAKIQNWTDKNVMRTLDALENGNLYTTKLLFDDLPTACKNSYTEATLRPFELTETLVVHAAMKMGKTKALLDYMTRYFNSALRPATIRFVSFRQTFSGNIKEKFTDFTLYRDVKGPLSGSKLIVQVESLYRLDIREGSEVPDLLILDECESIFEQFDSGLLRGNFNECFSKFQYLMRFSKHVVCMDANISDRTYRTLLQMRPAFSSAIADKHIIYHHNTHRNATDDNYFVCGDKLKWLGVLYSSIESDMKIAVPMSSLAEAKILAQNLSKKYTTKSIKLYSSETTQSEKREHFSDVNLHWARYDVLIYTPTVSAGVSFEQKHFDRVFGYFTDQSCPVETCQQMIGRVRDVSAHEFYICLSATGNNLPTEISALKQALYSRRENLLKNFDATGLHTEYGINGELIYHTGDYFHLWLENSRVRNLSKNSFIRRFIHIISQTGASLEFLSDEIYERNTGFPPTIDGELSCDLVEIARAHGEARAEIRADVAAKIANARELPDDEVDSIHSLIVAQADITTEQRAAFDKHRLRVDYKYEGEINEKFVEKYRDHKVRRMYKNISRIASYPTVESAWVQIQAEERANHKYLMELGEKSQYQDLNRKYVFDQHRYALGYLKLCGWANINDPQFIHLVSLAQNLTTGQKLYWDNIRPACAEFDIRAPIMQNALQTNDKMFVEYLLRPINKILNTMYGITISARKRDPNMYFIAQNKLFTTSATISNDKKKPLIHIEKLIIDAAPNVQLLCNDIAKKINAQPIPTDQSIQSVQNIQQTDQQNIQQADQYDFIESFFIEV
jgi:hypothetical protein